MIKKTFKKRSIIWGSVIVAAVAALTVAGVLLFKHNALSPEQWDELYAGGTYHEGITIDGVAVGGMTMAQAKEAVQAGMQQRLSEVSVTLEHEGQQFVLTKDDFSVGDNIDDVLKEAMSVAREGSKIQKSTKIGEIKASGLAFETAFTVDVSPAKARISEIAAGIDTPATDAALEVNKNDRKNRFTYTDEKNGIQVDQQALYAAVEKQVADGSYGTVKIPYTVEEPAVTKAELTANTVLRASSYTSFKNSPYNRESRVNNIKKAVGLVNGYMIKPGADFSTNTVLGPRTYERGWEPAPAVVRGGSEDQAGGGVCQVSTTMYLAALKSDLKIVNRSGHSIKLGYVEPGLDATINTGTIDFIYRNNTDHPIYVFCWVDSSKKTVNFEIYGQPFPEEFDEIRLSSEKTETLKPDGEMLVTIDNTKSPGYKEEVVKRREGSVYKSYKHYYKDGKQVKDPVLIATTKYKAYTGEMIVGPEPTPVPESTPEPATEVTQPTDSPEVSAPAA